MALIPTLVALGVGFLLGMRWGGSPSNLLDWRPALWPAGLAGVALMVVSDAAALYGTPGVLLRLAALGLVLAFALSNIRTGGMVLVVAGFGADFLVTLLNWGMPVSGSAMVSAGIVDRPSELEGIVLTGGREVSDGAVLGFLGDIIPLPWGQVISIGDILWLVGLALVTASALRRYEVPRRGSRGRGRGRRPRGRRPGSSPSYSASMSALSQGPAPRRGPGLHPSRLGYGRPGRPTR